MHRDDFPKNPASRVPREEPRIVSASRRTDVPGFHSRWLLNRLRAGFCHWIHPYNARVSRVSLRPRDVLGIVFWTRNPAPLLPHLRALRADGFPMVFQFTMTGYGRPIESHNPPLERQLAAAEEIARTIGPDALLWRYDPILLGHELDEAAHERRFTRLADRLAGLTRRCTFSFVDFYGKTERNLARVEAERGEFARPDTRRKRALVATLASIAESRRIALLSCCDDSLVLDGVGKSRCVGPAAIEAVRGRELPSLPFRPTRKDCGCVASVDIGTYDTCAFGCAYCYAVSSRRAALNRLREADPADSVIWRPPSLRGKDLDDLAASAAAASTAG